MTGGATNEQRLILTKHIHGYHCTYYIACFHVKPRRLLTAAPMLKTRDVNQNPLTEFFRGVSCWSNENCIVVAVTAEKKVATVDRFRRLLAAWSCAKRMVGTPGIAIIPVNTDENHRLQRTNEPISMKKESDVVMLSRCSPISEVKSWRYRWTAGYLNWPWIRVSWIEVTMVEIYLRMTSGMMPSTMGYFHGQYFVYR